MRELARVRTIITLSLAARLLIAAAIGFGVDEAYAVTVARPLALSYFDHPPLHFWIAGLTTTLTHSTSPWLMRVPFVLLFTITSVCIARVTAVGFTRRAARIAAMALSVSGVLGVVDGSWVLPDGPLLAATSVGVLLLAPMLIAEPRRAPTWWRWIAAGGAFGVAGLSKYHAVLLALGLATFLVTDRKPTANARRWWRTGYPYAAAVVAVLFAIPIVWWNATHQWASFAFQSARGVPSFESTANGSWHLPSLAPFAENIIGQIVWLLPWIALPLAWALWRAIVSGPSMHARWFFACLAMWPIGVFTLITLGGNRGLPHWQAPGWLFAFPLLGDLVDRALTQGRAWAFRWLCASVVATSAMVIALVLWIRVPSLATRLGVTPSRDPAIDLVSWRPVIDRIDQHPEWSTQPRVFAVRSWIQGGQLGATLDDRRNPILCLCRDPHQFAWRTPAIAWREVLLVDRDQSATRTWVSPTQSLAWLQPESVPPESVPPESVPPESVPPASVPPASVTMSWEITPLDTVVLARGVRVVVFRIRRAVRTPSG